MYDKKMIRLEKTREGAQDDPLVVRSCCFGRGDISSRSDVKDSSFLMEQEIRNVSSIVNNSGASSLWILL